MDIIIDDEGMEHKGEEEIAGVFAKFFQNLFTTSNPSDFEEILESIPKTITKTMNGNLTIAMED